VRRHMSRKDHQSAFAVVNMAIQPSLPFRFSNSRMPNLQLYDPMAAIAAKARNPSYLDEARRLLGEASLARPLLTSVAERQGTAARAENHRLLREEAEVHGRRVVRLWRMLGRVEQDKLKRKNDKDALEILNRLKASGKVKAPPELRLTKFKEQRIGVADASKQIGRRGTWSPEIWLSVDNAKSSHVVRQRGPTRHNRLHNRKMVLPTDLLK
jgi:hypothetical protein